MRPISRISPIRPVFSARIRSRRDRLHDHIRLSICHETGTARFRKTTSFQSAEHTEPRSRLMQSIRSSASICDRRHNHFDWNTYRLMQKTRNRICKLMI